MTDELDAGALNVAVFGGSFNPPHIAHVLAAVLVQRTSPIDRVVVVPTFRHPFGKALAPFDSRLEMCRLAMDGLSGVSVSTVERDLGGESRTLRTIESLALAHPLWKLRLVVGSDVLEDTEKWFRFDAIARLAPPLVLARAAKSTTRAKVLLPEISSTEVRMLIGRGAWEELEPLVPRTVLTYIRENHLYV